MSLSTTLNQLKRTSARGRADRVYAEARARHRALAPYATVGALLAATTHGSGATVAARDAIFAALVAELQLAPEPLWQSLLLVAFTPMLVRLRSILRNPSSDELDQTVLLAFIETARSLRFRTYVARNLFLLTRVRLFTELRRERRFRGLDLFDEETHPCDPFHTEAHQRAAAAQVVRLIEAEGGEELRDVLLATCERDESVREYVDRAYADCGERARARACKRLRLARLEVFAKLRAA